MGIADLIEDIYTPYIIENEGFRSNIYRDTKGKRTTGYGFNIDDPTVSALLPADVLSGERPMSEEEAYVIAVKLKDRAYNEAINYVGGIDIFNSMTPEQRRSIVDMHYNIGAKSMGGFKKMKKAIQGGDWTNAGKEMLDSKYYKDVPNRAKKNASFFGVNNGLETLTGDKK